MDVFLTMAEEHIRQSIQKGDFDHVPGKGKPLQLEDLSTVPEDLRMSYKVMKNAGMIPEEMQLKKEMLTIEDLIACCDDERERHRLKEKLNEKTIRFHQMMEKRKMRDSSALHTYRDKILRKLR